MLLNIFDGFKQQTDALHDMYTSEFMFHATGSRFFGTSKPESDYDFFVEDTDEVLDFLLELGFSVQKANGDLAKYGDISVSGILGLFSLYDTEHINPMIHVQLIYPEMMFTKNKVNEFFQINPSYLPHGHGKHEARVAWQIMMNLVNNVHIESKK